MKSDVQRLREALRSYIRKVIKEGDKADAKWVVDKVATALDATETTITLTSTVGLAQFGFIKVDNETIQYGGIESQYKDIDFFKSLDQYINNEWKKYNAHKALVLPTGRILKKLPGMNKLKLFNYIIQNLETKENIYKILEINKLLSKKKTKLILITYDSFLFDFSKEDDKNTLKNIKTILEGGNMVVKHKYGVNYAF